MIRGENKGETREQIKHKNPNRTNTGNLKTITIIHKK